MVKRILDSDYTCRGSVSGIEDSQRTITDIKIDTISKVLNV